MTDQEAVVETGPKSPEPESRFTRLTVVIIILSALAAAYFVPRLEVDNRLEQWLAHDPEMAVAYAAFRADFGSDEFLLAVLEGPTLEEQALLAQLQAVADIEAIPGVTSVRGPAQVWRDLFAAEDPEALADELLSNSFYRGLFITADGRTAALLIQVEPADHPQARREIYREVLNALTPLEAQDLAVNLVGSTALSAALDEVSLMEARRALPLALIGSLLILALLLRSWRAMAVAAICAGLTVLLTMGAIAALGRPLNMITTTLPPLLWVLSLGNVIHLLRRHLSSQDGTVRQALLHTRRACVLASTTTAAGFLSLVVAPMAPVRELGLFAAAGILMSLPVTLTLAPMLIRAFGVTSVGARSRPPTHSRLALAVMAKPTMVVVLTAAFGLAAAACLPLVRVTTDPVSFLPAEHQTAQSYHRVASMLGGFYTLEIVLEPPQNWTDPAATEIITDLVDDLELSPVVSKTVSALDVVKLLRRWDLVSSDTPPQTLAAGLDETSKSLLRSFVSEDGRRIRISAMVNEMNEQLFLDLVADARTAMAELPAPWRGTVTGQVLLLVEAQQRLVRTQLESLGLAAILVFVVLAIGLRSWPLVALSVVPNLLPLLAAFAAMAVLGLPLDPATVMVASIALGIAVDNTAHVLERLRQTIKTGAEMSEAVADTLRMVGPAMVTSSATAAIGFLSLIGSRFVPIHDFGLLSTLAVAVALLADLVLLPASALLLDRLLQKK